MGNKVKKTYGNVTAPGLELSNLEKKDRSYI